VILVFWSRSWASLLKNKGPGVTGAFVGDPLLEEAFHTCCSGWMSFEERPVKPINETAGSHPRPEIE